MSKFQVIGANFTQACKDRGFDFSANDSVVRVSKSFTPGDAGAFNRILSDAHDLLRIVPMSSPGSVWGGDGIGAYSAIKHGRVEVCKSGVTKSVVKAIVNLGQ